MLEGGKSDMTGKNAAHANGRKKGYPGQGRRRNSQDGLALRTLKRENSCKEPSEQHNNLIMKRNSRWQWRGKTFSKES